MSARWAAPAPTPSASSVCRQPGGTEADLARIHAPIGLDIGAQGPAEIALSIMAQVVQVLRGRKR